MELTYEFEGKLYLTKYHSVIDDMIERELISEEDRNLYDCTPLYKLTPYNRVIKVWRKNK